MKTNKNMRRFSEEQIKSLEILFEAESRPEPQLKQQLAEELGLQPRQVAIWFQNRRARFKTKRIERDYCQLKASYDTLASSFESLKTENQALLCQKQNLKRQLGKPTGRQEGNSSNGELAKGDPEPKETPSCVSERDAVCTGEETSIPDLLQRRDGSETSIPDVVQLRDGSETSSGDWNSFECSCFLDDPIGNSQWWEQ